MTGKEEIQGEENVMTPEDFSDVEKKEGRGSGPLKSFGIFAKKDEKENFRAAAGRSDFRDPIVEMGMKLERLSSRIELLEEARKNTEERIADTAEKIGELRSSLMDRDRSFNDATARFERMSDLIEGIEPEKIRKEISRKDQEVEQLRAQVESGNERQSAVMKRLKDISDELESFRSLKDMVSVAEDLDKKRKIMEDLKRDVERNVGKFETRLYELNDTISLLRKSIGMIEADHETLTELMRTIDKLSMRLEKYETAPELSQKEKELDNRVSDMKFDLESKISKLIDTVRNIELSSGRDYLESRLSKLSELETDLREINEKIGSFSKEMKDVKSEGGRFSKAGELEAQIKSLKGEVLPALVSEMKTFAESQSRINEAKVSSEIKGIIAENEDKYSQKFVDIELKLLELSKSVDHRIESRVSRESRAMGEVVDGKVPSFSSRALPVSFASPVQDRHAAAEDLSRMVNDIYSYLDSGNQEEARLGFIRLLSMYEKQESSNPFILAKITDLHRRIRELK